MTASSRAGVAGVCLPSKTPLKRITGWMPIVVTCILSTFYLTRFQAESPIRHGGPQFLTSAPGAQGGVGYFTESQDSKRLIVFGDSWSDNGRRPVADPAHQRAEARMDTSNHVWTDWLCTMISCVHHDNFARSTASLTSTEPLGPRGAVVDSTLLNSTWMKQTRTNHSSTILQQDITEPLADLITQIREWVSFEKEQYGTSRVKEAERESTVFSIWFSLWDLWYYTGGVFSNAEVAVTRSLDTLFAQLDVISENWPLKPRVILPDAIDLTFLPGWRKKRTGINGTDPIGEDQRYAVLLVEQWNRALRERARRWDKGSIYIYPAGDWLLNQIRQDQLVKANLKDANGMGIDPSPWINVHSACLGQDEGSSEEVRDNGHTIHCQDPDSYLFWDDFNLGSTAMRMMGQTVAADIMDPPGKRTGR